MEVESSHAAEWLLAAVSAEDVAFVCVGEVLLLTAAGQVPVLGEESFSGAAVILTWRGIACV